MSLLDNLSIEKEQGEYDTLFDTYNLEKSMQLNNSHLNEASSYRSTSSWENHIS